MVFNILKNLFKKLNLHFFVVNLLFYDSVDKTMQEHQYKHLLLVFVFSKG
jgi:hypothetical protein